MQRSNHLPISLEELSRGAGTVGVSLQTPLRFRNRCRANRDAKDQLLVGVLSPSYLAAVCLSLCKCHCSCPPPGCCIIRVGFAVCLGGLKKAGGKKEAAKSSPFQELPVQDSSCSRSASVLGSACLPRGVRRADCLFLCSR